MALGTIALAAPWFFILTVLVLDFAGILRRGTARRWQGTGLLVMNSAALIGGVARLRGWSVSQIDTLDAITFPVTLAGFAVLVIGLAGQVKARRNREGRVGRPGEYSYQGPVPTKLIPDSADPDDGGPRSYAGALWRAGVPSWMLLP